MLIRVGELDTFYEADGQGPPVVLLHGWGTSGRSLEGVAAGLADRFRVVRLDLPGFGWSQAPAAVWGTAEYATHVRGCLEGLEIGRTALIGHSFGGRLAIRLAATEPERVARLGLVASAGIRPPRTPGVQARIVATKLLRVLAGLPGLGPLVEPFRARWVARAGSRDYRAAGRLRPILVRVVGEDLRALLPRLAAPTLLLWGDKDPEVGREAMRILAEGIRGARLTVFPGAGHFPFDDAPAEFLRTLRGFLEEGERW